MLGLNLDFVKDAIRRSVNAIEVIADSSKRLADSQDKCMKFIDASMSITEKFLEDTKDKFGDDEAYQALSAGATILVEAWKGNGDFEVSTLIPDLPVNKEE